MEVTFLSSTGSFRGVGYNLSKVSVNTAQILEVANFKGLKYISSVPTIGDYTEYLQNWSSLNKHIKNSQFHVAISCRGTEKTKEELLSVAKQWLKEMGYEDIPTLFVFHNDTNNNHLHIITSRVDPNGKKVNDSNERWRGRAVLKKIEGINIGHENHEKDVRKALSYRITNISQFALILEQQNYKVTELENGDLEITKYGKRVATVTIEELNKTIEEGQHLMADEGRKKQLKALLYKYKENLSLSELKDLMKRTFGVQLVFFGKADKPYGYAAIDHKGKSVYKGSEILPLKELLENTNNREKNEDNRFEKGCSIIEAVLAQNKYSTSYEVRATLRTYGYTIKEGRLYRYGEDLGRLEEGISNQLEYNKRLALAREVHTDNPDILDAVTRHFKVNRDDLFLTESEATVMSNKGYHSLQELYDKAFQSGDIFAYLKLNNAYLFQDRNKTYIIDKDLGEISEVETMNPDRALVVSIDNFQAEHDNPSIQIDDVAEIFIGKGEEGVGANNEVKRRRHR